MDSYSLLYSEIYLSLCCQENNGHFIIKFFDLFNLDTIKLIYLLYLCYEEIIFIKPKTSRPSNSEKYVVCKNYKYNEDVLKYMRENWKDKVLNIDLSNNFLHLLYEFNLKFVEKQIKNINVILENKNYYNDNKKYCIEWCKKYKMPYKI